jgi:hypothetical protein
MTRKEEKKEHGAITRRIFRMALNATQAIHAYLSQKTPDIVVTCRHMSSHVVTIDIVWHLARTPVSSLLHLLRPTGCQLRFRCGLPQLPSIFNVFHSDIETTSIHITYFPTFFAHTVLYFRYCCDLYKYNIHI